MNDHSRQQAKRVRRSRALAILLSVSLAVSLTINVVALVSGSADTTAPTTNTVSVPLLKKERLQVAVDAAVTHQKQRRERGRVSVSPGTTVESQLEALLSGCTLPRTEDFRIGLHISSTGEVRKVYVSAKRSESEHATCARNRLSNAQLNTTLQRQTYFEWRFGTESGKAILVRSVPSR